MTLDLFYSGGFDSKLRTLKKDIREFARRKGYNLGSRIYLAVGDRDYIGNCILLILPPLKPDQAAFSGDSIALLKEELSNTGLDKYFITSSYPIPIAQVSKEEIKEFSPFVSKLIELLSPRLIVTLGEAAQFALFKRKFLLRENHGKIIGQHNNIDIFTTYELEYYKKRIEFEDNSYKEYIKNSDWGAIRDLYLKLIDKET